MLMVWVRALLVPHSGRIICSSELECWSALPQLSAAFCSFLVLGMGIFLGAEWVQQMWNISSGCCQVRCVWLPITGCRWYLTGWEDTCWGWGRGSDLHVDDRDKMVHSPAPLKEKQAPWFFLQVTPQTLELQESKPRLMDGQLYPHSTVRLR